MSCCPQVQVTKVKLEQKQREGIAEARSGRRSLVGGSAGLQLHAFPDAAK